MLLCSLFRFPSYFTVLVSSSLLSSGSMYGRCTPCLLLQKMCIPQIYSFLLFWLNIDLIIFTFHLFGILSDLSREEIAIAKRYPSNTALCIRAGWDLCCPEQAVGKCFNKHSRFGSLLTFYNFLGFTFPWTEDVFCCSLNFMIRRISLNVDIKNKGSKVLDV